VLSDMLGNSSGRPQQDHFRSMDLCLTALEFSRTVLNRGGSLCAKYLRGRDEEEFMRELKRSFEDVKIVKPKASRSESAEMYVLARGCLDEKDEGVK
jgi:23S rRNA (uridine2552-2'-O)-methyltransferase